MSRLEDMWWRRDEPPFARLLLSPLALPELLFRGGVAVRNALYSSGLLGSARAGAPVISVGNLAVGGSGKTPAALEVVRRLLLRGRRVALLSRGYGATRRDARVVSDGSRLLLADAGLAGDEPLLLARREPALRVLCGPRRAELAAIAVGRLGADALVLDDGFQHRALGRDLDLVVLDGANPWGNGRLLPRGPNREGRPALRRSQLAWISRVDQGDEAGLRALRALAREATGRPPVESRHAVADILDGGLGRSLGRGALAGRRLLLLAGIGRPQGFRRTVEGLGATVGAERLYPDHHRFTDAELASAFEAARATGCDGVVTTEKDAIRLSTRWAGEAMLQVVRIEAEVVRGGELLDEAIERALASGRGDRP